MTVEIAAVRDHYGPAGMALAEIRTADGRTVSVPVARSALVDGRLPIGAPVGHRADGAVLIEFPAETIEGAAWREWVLAGSLCRERDGPDTEAGEGRGMGGEPT